jgi:hypothetical protein
MPTYDEIQSQVRELQSKALEYLTSLQTPVVESVTKATTTLADALPEDRPELLVRGIDAAVYQARFAKKAIDAGTSFAKAVIDAAVKPFAPAKKRTVKAA